MDIDSFNWQLWDKALYWLSSAGLWLYTFFSNRQRVTISKIEAIEKTTTERIDALEQLTTTRMGNHDTRLTCMESDIKHVPTQSDLMFLSRQISDMNGLLKNVEGRLSGINRAVDLINEFLINNKSEKG